MKSKIGRIVCCTAALALLCICFAACESEPPVPPDPVGDLSAEQVATIRAAYFEQFHGDDHSCKDRDVEHVLIDHYFGTYNGNIVVCVFHAINSTVGCAIVDINVDGIEICAYPDTGYSVMVYLDPAQNPAKNLIKLNAAYEQGFITKADLHSIAAAAAYN